LLTQGGDVPYMLWSPDKKLYGNRLYWCIYIRDINGARKG